MKKTACCNCKEIGYLAEFLPPNFKKHKEYSLELLTPFVISLSDTVLGNSTPSEHLQYTNYLSIQRTTISSWYFLCWLPQSKKIPMPLIKHTKGEQSKQTNFMEKRQVVVKGEWSKTVVHSS